MRKIYTAANCKTVKFAYHFVRAFILSGFCVLAVNTVPLSALQAQSKVGTTAANFLTIPIGPRATGMGGAFVAVANDATAAFWNSGGLSRLPSNEIILAHSEWFVGTKVNWLGLNIHLGDDDAIAFSINQLDYGKEEITTASEPMGTGQQWDAMDIAFGISYARNLTDRFSIGGTAKYIQQRIWNESADAFALDIGLLFATDYSGLKIGMNIANFGTEMKLSGKDLLYPIDIDPSHAGNNENIVTSLETKSWTLPLVFTVGLGMDVLNTETVQWTAAIDAVYPNNQTSYLNLGTEITWENLLVLRTGYNSLFKESAEEGLAGGIGVKYRLGAIDANVDYSYMQYGIFNAISRYSLTLRF
ncbi:MAG: PorV/PorQ family protein [Bacteroidota bacterium]